MHVPIEHHLTSFVQVLVTIDHSFGHNLSFIFPNGKCQFIFNICTFNGIKKGLNLDKVFYLHFCFKDSKPLQDPPSGSVETHFLAHLWGIMFESNDYLLAHFTFHALNLFASSSLQLGHKYTLHAPQGQFYLCEVLYHVKNGNCEGIKFYKKLKPNIYLKKFNLLVDFSKKFNVHTLRI